MRFLFSFLFLHLNKLSHSNAWPGIASKKIEYLVNVTTEPTKYERKLFNGCLSLKLNQKMNIEKV